uniref:Uncharacterized protein n=1 Tax=Vespula pensylvanica TaxID=30213 RepID=A0A834UCW2_VESPE|nr:hypothetical protein H0235_004809 [Vespula pensylvanica]
MNKYDITGSQAITIYVAGTNGAGGSSYYPSQNTKRPVAECCVTVARRADKLGGWFGQTKLRFRRRWSQLSKKP